MPRTEGRNGTAGPGWGVQRFMNQCNTGHGDETEVPQRKRDGECHSSVGILAEEGGHSLRTGQGREKFSGQQEPDHKRERCDNLGDYMSQGFRFLSLCSYLLERWIFPISESVLRVCLASLSCESVLQSLVHFMRHSSVVYFDKKQFTRTFR